MIAVDRRRSLLLAGSALALGALPARARAQTLIPVHVGASIDDGLTPLLYALKTGIFRRNGLDVNLTSASNGAYLATAVAGGALDIGKSALLPLINAHLHGIHFKLLAGADVYKKGQLSDQIIVLRDGPIRSLADMVGKTVALATLQSLDQMATEASIDQHGGNSSSCRYIEIAAAAIFEALVSGRADLASIAAPVVQAALATGKMRSFGNPYEALGTRLLIAGWFCTEAYAEQNPAVVHAFASSVDEAAAYTNVHHEETIPIVSAYTGISPDVLRQMRSDTNATSLNPKYIQPAIDAAYKYKFIPATFVASEMIAAGLSVSAE